MNIEKVLRGVVIAGLFAIPFIPLVIAQDLFFPFITGKNFAFRILVEIVVAAWLVLALVDTKYRPRWSGLWVGFAIFVAVIGLADVFGANAAKSLWSNYERMEGWVTLAHLFAYLTVLYSTLRTEVVWRRLLHTSIGVSVLVGLYGIFQLLGFLTINQGGVRLDATFGNATYLAVYMLFHLFLTALMWERTWRDQGFSWMWTALYGAIMVLQAGVLFFTATRGAILGLIGGALLSALLLVLFAHMSKNAWRAAIGVLVGLVVLSGGFYLIRDTDMVRSIEPLRRLSDISLTETTVVSRFYNYGMAWKGFEERPLLGWGQENYNLVFNKYYDPRMYAQEPWFDRVHNVIFDWLIAGGIVGLLSYLALFALALWGIWRSGAFVVAERAILTGLLAGYFFHNLFVFDNVTSYIMWVIVLAYIAHRVADARNASTVESMVLPHKLAIPAALVAVVALWGTAYGVNAAGYQANATLLKALSPQASLQNNIEYFNEALAYNSFGNQEIREQLVQGATQIVQSPQATPEQKGVLYELAVTEMQKQVSRAPDDARFPLFLGVLFSAAGERDKAYEAITLAHQLSPTKQSILFQLASNELSRGDKESALTHFKEAYELDTSYDSARMYYAGMLIEAGMLAEADVIMQPLLDNGTAADQRIVGPLIEKNDFARVEKIWLSTVEHRPQDPQAWFGLAAARFTAGNKAGAITALEDAAKAIPAIAPQAQGLIQQIKDGTAKVER